MTEIIKVLEDVSYNELMSPENSSAKEKIKGVTGASLEAQGNWVLVIVCKHGIERYYVFQGLEIEKQYLY